MALVAIKRYRLDEASKYIDEALVNEKPLLPIRRVKFWLDLQRKDQAAQKGDVRKLTSILAVNSALAERADYQETARWLGVALGYYSEPGKSQLPAADLEALDAEVSGQLKGPWAKSLTEGRNSVGEQFKKLQANLVDVRKQVKARNEAKRADDRQKNDTDLRDCNGKLRTAQLELARIQNRQLPGIGRVRRAAKRTQRPEKKSAVSANPRGKRLRQERGGQKKAGLRC